MNADGTVNGPVIYVAVAALVFLSVGLWMSFATGRPAPGVIWFHALRLGLMWPILAVGGVVIYFVTLLFPDKPKCEPPSGPGPAD
jgi:hypothetical protein